MGHSWDVLEASWDALGTLLGCSGGSSERPGRSWLDFGPSQSGFWALWTSIVGSPQAAWRSAWGSNVLRLTCERLASDSQVRRAHCVGRHSSESTQVDPSRRQTDRHTLRSKSSTSLPESQADRQTHVAKQKLDDLTARLSGRSCKRSGQRIPRTAPIDALRLTDNSGQSETNKLHRF